MSDDALEGVLKMSDDELKALQGKNVGEIEGVDKWGGATPAVAATLVVLNTGAAAFDVALAYDDYKRNEFIEAAGNTNFDTLYALTNKDANFTWLVWAVSGLGLELGAFLRIFKSLKQIAPAGIRSTFGDCR